MLTFLTRHLFAEKLNGKVYKAGGLKRDKKDKRDFNTEKLGWGFGYTPKNRRFVISTLSVKDQMMNNTCTQVSATVQKEIDEKCELSEESLTCFAKLEGEISGNGFATLRGIQKVIQKWGIAEKALLDKPSNNWEIYSSSTNLTQEVRENAASHKSKSFWSVNNRNDRLKVLEEGRILHTGLDWYSGFNMSGGFSSPWIIKGGRGVVVGGHAVVIKGFDLDKNVYIFQNSYGKSWGDNGDFYVDMDYFDRYGYLPYAQLDIPVDTASFLNAYQFKFVKGSGPAVYQIMGDRKCAFPDMATLEAYTEGAGKENVERVSDEILNQIQDGEMINIEDSPLWPMIKKLSTPDRYKEVLKHLTK